jgi:hypothetical protein
MDTEALIYVYICRAASSLETIKFALQQPSHHHHHNDIFIYSPFSRLSLAASHEFMEDTMVERCAHPNATRRLLDRQALWSPAKAHV